MTDEETERIRKDFRRCGDEAVEAILRFRQTRDLSTVPVIVRGIIRRYLPAHQLEAFATATETTQLADLQVESLTMLEIILDVQDALEVTVEDSEMREFKTLGDVQQFLERKVAAAA
ncbi:MAG: hypothetical protein QOD99_2248 [Chthoniobacter sp.]|jgi:3-hydroxyacyl-[acyl-carrier-protein] dehydratase|nr:hypothetical protein [Chthoniobacter sp.]